jgi:hypothetical protein
MTLEPWQIQILRETLKNYGALNMAANSIGMTSRDLRATIARNPDLKAEVDDAMEDHREALYATAVERATNGRSDPLLGKLLEAQMPTLFDPKARNASLSASNKPTGVTLRRFEEAEDGSVVDVEAKPPEEPSGAAGFTAPPPPAADPLMIVYDGKVRI